ncbi:MAG: gamma-glutamyl-gamma-aminobutyrate hydrolase family protein, partial [Phycisphaerales bacterium]|nr:gamma-glutamyl-gamma-aminobutyrate hydrolase family protein [Phycisphaerales bacterium]
MSSADRPLIGITPDVEPLEGGRWRARVGGAYLEAVTAAGGLPVVLHPDAALAPEYVERMDGLLLSGGNDIDTSRWGVALHTRAVTMHAQRQVFEVALLRAIDRVGQGDTPTLGVCLGMQMMGVHRSGIGSLVQHLPDEVPGAGRHASVPGLGDAAHGIMATAEWERSRLAGVAHGGTVASSHHQGIRREPAERTGGLRTLAVSEDGVLEAFDDPARAFYV